MFSILDKNGKLTSQEFNKQIPFDSLTSWYKSMQTLSIMDLILYEAQRQGRISFYMTNYGEEATHLGSAAALTLGISS